MSRDTTRLSLGVGSEDTELTADGVDRLEQPHRVGDDVEAGRLVASIAARPVSHGSAIGKVLLHAHVSTIGAVPGRILLGQAKFNIQVGCKVLECCRNIGNLGI